MELVPDQAKSPATELLPTRPSLLARLRNHDDSRAWHRGWEEFYALYQPVICGYALKHGLSESEADDVVQEIVIGLTRSLPKFEYDPARSSFKTWLFRVARNKIMDHFRSRHSKYRSLAGSLELERDAEALAEVPDENVL